MQDNLIWILKQVSLSLDQYTKDEMRNMELSPSQGIMLQYLLTCERQDVCSTDLHRVLGISKASVSSTLKILRQKGYLKMEGNTRDDRKKTIILTQKAYDAQQQICESLARQEQYLCRRIPTQRVKWLEEDLDQMLCNLKEEP